jgi:hypothetical protein
MNWPDFFFGSIAGALATAISLAVLSMRVLQPFLDAAKIRSEASVAPPINWRSTGNDPDVGWPSAKQGKEAP